MGIGQMGSGIARLVLARQGLELAAVFDRRSLAAGENLAELLGVPIDTHLVLDNDLATAIQRARPDVAIQATCSRLDDAAADIFTLLAHGVNVISIAEQMAWPAATSAERARELDRMAVAHQASVLGTGINPGFVLDLLVIALSGVCQDIQSIHASRINDLAPYGPAVLQTQGVGLSPEAFEAGLASGAVVGHFGFAESIHMIAAKLGWDVEKIEERREPILSTVPRQTPFVSVAPGQVAGCRHRAVAYRDGQAIITLDHPQQIHPAAEGIETGDSIEIRGTPTIRLGGSPEIPGGQGTIALAVNMIPRILEAAPGLYSMADLPVPAAMLGGLRPGQRSGLS
jgi:4-hydroxy-tetrahydrodipicolinate reductase